MLIDLHAKTQLSDDVTLSARQVLQQASDAGLDGVAFCETRSTARAPEVLALAKAEFSDLAVFFGVEIPTDRGILLGFVPEIDQFFLNEEWAWLTHRTTPSADAVIDLFDEQNGVVLAARPYDLQIPFNMGDYIFEFDRLGGVEVFTSRVGDIQSNFALEAATFLGLGTFGGSDPTGDINAVGRYATFFEESFTTQRRLVDTLRDSEFWAVELGVDKKPSSSKKPRSNNGRSSRSKNNNSRRRNGGSRRRRSRN